LMSYGRKASAKIMAFFDSAKFLPSFF